MEQGKSTHQQMFQQDHSPWIHQYVDHHEIKNNNIDHEEKKCTSSTSTSSIGEDSMASNGSSMSSISDTADDASSSASSSVSSNSSGALYDLSEIMAQLPIKRGLSKFYQGKSESFTSLASVTSIEDLAKKATPYRRNLKASKSCGNGLNSSYKHYNTLPKPIITKKATRGGSFSSFLSKRASYMSSGKPPLTPTHRNLDC